MHCTLPVSRGAYATHALRRPLEMPHARAHPLAPSSAPGARHVRCVLYGWLGKIRKKAAESCAAMRARRDWRQVSESQSVHARAAREERRGPRALKQKSLSQDSAGGAGYLVEL